jgi:ATP-dependent Zn protease
MNGEEDVEKKDEVKDLMILSLLKKDSNNTNSYFSDSKDDSLNLGCVLSRLDGIGNYNGLILIASTNCKDNLSPALYRSGRLSPMYFDFCRKEDIINMIEFNYNIKLSQDQISKLPDRTHSISPATLRKYIDEESNYENLINILNQKIK